MQGKFWKGSAFLAVLLLVVASLGGCGGSSSDDKKDVKPAVFKGWEGKWTSMYAAQYMDSEPMKKFFEDVAEAYNKKAPNSYTADGAKGWFEEKRYTRFSRIDVAGDTITFYGVDRKTKEEKEVGKVVYVSMGTRDVPTKSGKVRTWYLFKKATAEDTTPTPERGSDAWKDPLARYAYLAFFKVNDSAQPVHFHLRYGYNVDANIFAEGEENWYPAVVKDGTTPEQVAADDSPADFAEGMPKPLEPWNGEWISMAAILSDAKLTPAFEKVAAEVKKLGVEMTAEDVRKQYVDNYKTDFDTIIVKDGKYVTFKNGGVDVAANVTYTNAGEYWINGSDPKYAKIWLTDPHGSADSLHWHMQYGEGIGSQTWWPTYFSMEYRDARVDAYVKRYTEKAADYAKRIVEAKKKKEEKK